MIKEVIVTVDPEQAFDSSRYLEFAAAREGIEVSEIQGLKLRKRSIDARGNKVKYVLRFLCAIGEPLTPEPAFEPKLQDVSQSPEVHIIGAGPAGLFAAIRLIELGLKPVIIERGKTVRDRRRDLANLTKNQIVNPESNYCFGEGGAGTYSDGKLYTRSEKRGDVNRILRMFIHFGADDDIDINSRPHIGTNKLPVIIEAMREAILKCGGEVHFNTRLDDIGVSFGKITSITLNGTQVVPCTRLILATGHSSDMIYRMLHEKGIRIEAKPFALGVRTEHSQDLIDKIQYHGVVRNDYLPPAYYSLVTQVGSLGVYSFCMCPGGIMAPCTTEEGYVVTNGWSPSKRNNPYSNSGIVTEITLPDLSNYSNPKDNPLVGLEFQRMVEKAACIAGGGTQVAPAQRVADLANGKRTQDLPECSYTPGVVPADLSTVIPGFVLKRLRKAFSDFGKMMPGWLTNEAIAVAVESRTSSPVRIPRDKFSFEHIQIKGLYPCGEGAGYAGGIASAAIDGEKCAEAVARSMGFGNNVSFSDGVAHF
jgi:uncharacterized FAD-dependent dehydrogenase